MEGACCSWCAPGGAARCPRRRQHLPPPPPARAAQPRPRSALRSPRKHLAYGQLQEQYWEVFEDGAGTDWEGMDRDAAQVMAGILGADTDLAGRARQPGDDGSHRSHYRGPPPYATAQEPWHASPRLPPTAPSFPACEETWSPYVGRRAEEEEEGEAGLGPGQHGGRHAGSNFAPPAWPAQGRPAAHVGLSWQQQQALIAEARAMGASEETLQEYLAVVAAEAGAGAPGRLPTEGLPPQARAAELLLLGDRPGLQQQQQELRQQQHQHQQHQQRQHLHLQQAQEEEDEDAQHALEQEEVEAMMQVVGAGV